jgi:L-glutamine-phosphate cytidylyltransferase
VNSTLSIVLLVAGRGMRLGGEAPKCLTPLHPGAETILDRQLRCLAGVAPDPFTAVVGFRKDLVRAAHPELQLVANERFAETNTARSLQAALANIHDRDVLWLNGDVVFDKGIVPLLLASGGSCMAVNRARCGDEEIKYRSGSDGRIVEVSKQVRPGEGEAVGINLVRAADLGLFKECLAECADKDYFERGLELAINRGMVLRPVDIGELPCIEVDFPEDLHRAQELFGDGKR